MHEYMWPIVTKWVTCQKIKQIELVISLEQIFINLSNGAKIMELIHVQPTLFDTQQG